MIKIQTKNEHPFYPVFGANGETDDSKKFTVVLKKLNDTLHANLWADYKFHGENEIDMKIDPFKKVKAHLVKLENAPDIEVDGGESRPLTVEDILKFDELSPLVEEIYLFLLNIKKDEATSPLK